MATLRPVCGYTPRESRGNPQVRQPVKDFLNTEITDWYHRGIIDEKLRELLAARYERGQGSLGSLVKWLGYFAMFFLGSSLLSFLAIAADSPAGGVVILAVVTVLFWRFGLRLIRRVPHPAPVTGGILVTAALGALYGALWLLAFIASDGNVSGQTSLTLVYLLSAASFATAYLYRLRWPLFLGLLILFHAIGSGSAYVGSGTYVADIVDEKMMALVALISVIAGLLHEHTLEDDSSTALEGFGRLYVTFGLLYFNCSIWFLSLRPFFGPSGDAAVGPILLFTAASVAQIVLGARLKDARFTGYGIVFLGIDMYTRYFEMYWNEMSVGMFFLAGGLVAVFGGFVLEAKLGMEKAV